jgi:REP element-mobilizing transposase RayT
MKERKHPRLQGYDYSTAGYYFVTICTHDRKCLFWEEIRAGLEPAPTLNCMGKLALQAWLDLPVHTTGVRLDHFVVMPNHVHGIIVLESPNPVGAGSKPAQAFTPLPEVIRQFKTFSARKINALRESPGEPLWQRSYYDHVIRDDEDYLRIWQYIDTNPARWIEDKYYTAQES